MKYLVTMLALIILAGCGLNQRTRPAPVVTLLDVYQNTPIKANQPHVATIVVIPGGIERATANVATGRIKKEYAKATVPKVSNQILESVKSMSSLYPSINRIGAVELAHWVESQARETDLPPRLILAIAAVESDFKTNTCSSHGACGIMGIKGSTWNLSKRTLRNPKASIEHGSNILAHYRDQCRPGPNRLKCAIQRYNRGPANYDAGARAPKYVAEVTKHIRLMGGRF